MRIYAFILACVLAGLTPRASHAGLDEPNEVYSRIAICLGRYSAQLEHTRLMGETVELATARFDSFDELYSALEGSRELLSLRITQKAQHARLLETASFNTDPRRRRLAAQRARAHIATCDQLELS